VVIVVAAWMLDPAACAGMGFGAPRVAISGLVELHHLLIERGFRRSSRDDPIVVQEEQDEKPADSGRLRGMSLAERSTALARMARLLLEAAGVATEERSDDER
jgi:hypothetical protein